MSSNIPSLIDRFNFPGSDSLVDVRASIDTVHVLARWYDKAFTTEVRASTSGKVISKPIKVGGVTVWRETRITRPTALTFKVLRRWRARKRFGINRLHVATDWEFEEEEASSSFRDWCASHIDLNWSTQPRLWYTDIYDVILPRWVEKHWPEDEPYDLPETLFWQDTTGRKAARRELAMYPNIKGLPITRLELRFENTAAVTANGLQTLVNPSYPLRVNPRALFSKHLSLKRLPSGYVEKQIKGALVRNMVKQQTPANEQWRADRIPSRVRGVIEAQLIRAPERLHPMVKLEGSDGFFRLIPDRT